MAVDFVLIMADSTCIVVFITSMCLAYIIYEYIYIERDFKICKNIKHSKPFSVKRA